MNWLLNLLCKVFGYSVVVYVDNEIHTHYCWTLAKAEAWASWEMLLWRKSNRPSTVQLMKQSRTLRIHHTYPDWSYPPVKNFEW